MNTTPRTFVMTDKLRATVEKKRRRDDRLVEGDVWVKAYVAALPLIGDPCEVADQCLTAWRERFAKTELIFSLSKTTVKL